MITFKRPILGCVGAMGLSVLALCGTAPLAQAQVGHRVPPGQLPTEAQIDNLIATAVPMELIREGRGNLPAPEFLPVSPAASEGPIRIRAGFAGRAESFRGAFQAIDPSQSAREGRDPVDAPLDFGSGNENTIYHYTDYLLTPYPVSVYPYRAVGKLFSTLNGDNYVCSAALISSSIIVTAGHCLNDGEGGFASQAVFVPAYSASTPGDHYGHCSVTHIWTTPEWNSGFGGAFDYDVAVALCGRTQTVAGRGHLIGMATGWLGFCYRNCRMPYFMDTQVGYPQNYYRGGEMTVSQHLAETVSAVIGGYITGAYIHGSGMGVGSSGGPHIMNAGVIDERSVHGAMPDRNVTLAVTSFRVEGAPQMTASVALSGVNNRINFRRMFNLACRESRRSLGRRSCDPIR